ncbi:MULTISPECIES: flagellar biosynthetic protein FliQ [Clostridium]|jgi:Flagellar biosynthesis pathway, component FliQ|uniref:Flagellar biosynthetic protein FliQ n=5 Tax=Clostridium TaxID=1485 RepID=A0A0B5QG54_CLOBE|nr:MULTISPECIES: flagellar biosynthetic protein FliQ [Clostridium]ABR36365.1 export protein FliQ, family 3 [Clostridium beijerinckii NCIMB 8052]AIU02207.1 export protein FliQ [Clostridium beijerinckii ATCC 35702]AJH01305.1 flagellar biosynthetic protein FliQ [Clostridium beijerinckii]ALB44554.1 flagellar biosynthetic protein FliQ [Clostridium beijerinckii NRRL B-598]AVK48253.1 flagellar biosynthetic protein FliQ [Clostridium sp. MF28]
MTQTMLNAVVKDTIITAAKVSAPILIVVLVLGLAISIIQATTQIQEQTLTFVPKLIAAAIVGIFLGSWMLETIMSFTNRIFDLISKVIT